MKMHKLFFAGFGGQGILLAGQMLAYAGLMEGKEVTFLPSYGPEMRGGTANCTVIVSHKPISCPIIDEATCLVAMNQPSLLKFEDMVMPGGHLFLNTSLISAEVNRNDVILHRIDAGEIAKQAGHEKAANMVMLGAVVKSTGVVKRESIEQVMEETFKGAKAFLLHMNKKAFGAGYNLEKEESL